MMAILAITKSVHRSGLTAVAWGLAFVAAVHQLGLKVD
jgi:hypothetical protein